MWQLSGSLFWGVGIVLTWCMILTFSLSAVGLVDVQLAPADALFVEQDMNKKTILRFDDNANLERWIRVNDNVMGGISEGALRFTDRNTALFTGNLSLENHGGFASVRTHPHQYDLGAYDGIAVRVKGDGRYYKLRIRTDDRWDGVAYSADFETIAGEWTTVYVRFNQFVPTFRGWRVSNAPALSGDQVRQIGLMIADKRGGPFELEVDSVIAYQDT